MSSDDLFQPAQEQTNFWDSNKYLFVVQDIKRGEYSERYNTTSNVWTFEVYYDLDREPVRVTESGDVCTLTQFISPNMTPNSRGRPIVEAILGRKLSDDEVVSKDDLVGGSFFGLLSNEKSKETGKTNPYVRSPEVAKASRRVVRRPVKQDEETDELPF